MASDEESEESEADKDSNEETEPGDSLPPMLKKLSKKSVGTKGPPRVQYEYRYSNNPSE